MNISVVIPTHNKKSYLALTLQAFNLQSYPHDQFEVVVVNDGSTDGTEQMLERIETKYSLRFVNQKTEDALQREIVASQK